MKIRYPHCPRILEIADEWAGRYTAPASYRYYRLNITANHGAEVTQLSEMGLLAAPAVPASNAVTNGIILKSNPARRKTVESDQ
jgi:hypothetical protein